MCTMLPFMQASKEKFHEKVPNGVCACGHSDRDGFCRPVGGRRSIPDRSGVRGRLASDSGGNHVVLVPPYIEGEGVSPSLNGENY